MTQSNKELAIKKMFKKNSKKLFEKKNIAYTDDELNKSEDKFYQYYLSTSVKVKEPDCKLKNMNKIHESELKQMMKERQKISI